jgi:hypothetical protein
MIHESDQRSQHFHAPNVCMQKWCAKEIAAHVNDPSDEFEQSMRMVYKQCMLPSGTI